MKKALIHDWYTVYGGAERCVESMTNIWDDFDHFSLIDDLSDENREIILKGKPTKNSFIQKSNKHIEEHCAGQWRERCVKW